MATLTPASPSLSAPQIASPKRDRPSFDLWKPLRRWLDRIQVSDPRFAHLICQMIPDRCPLERDVTLFGRTVHIPALCKLNPLYNELVSLRYRALTYLTDVCGEDVTRYICY